MCRGWMLEKGKVRIQRLRPKEPLQRTSNKHSTTGFPMLVIDWVSMSAVRRLVTESQHKFSSFHAHVQLDLSGSSNGNNSSKNVSSVRSKLNREASGCIFFMLRGPERLLLVIYQDNAELAHTNRHLPPGSKPLRLSDASNCSPLY
jgi:hypothetical protein